MFNTTMTIDIEERDQGWKAMKVRAQNLHGWNSLVGIFEGMINDKKSSKDGDKKSKGTPIAEYMGYQETGTKNKDGSTRIPETPWMRTMVDARTAHYQERLGKAEQDVILGTITAEQALNSIAMELAGDLIRSITIFGLVDTGAARQNIKFLVYKGKREGDSEGFDGDTVSNIASEVS